MKEAFHSLDFYLLLLYSFLPGIGKVTGQQSFMVLCLPIILMLFFRHKERKIIFAKLDIVFLYFVFYVFFLCIIQYLNPTTDKLGLFMGAFLSGVPMLGYLYSRKVELETLSKYLVFIAIAHLILGILIYPPFGLHIVPEELNQMLNEGVMFGRMSSVSGSLGFGVLMFLAGIMAFFYNRSLYIFIIIGVVFSAQRSAWLASFFLIVMLLYYNFKKRRALVFFKIVFALLGCTLLLLLFADFLGIDTSFLLARFNEIDSGVSERWDIWIAGVDNFKSHPIGVGIGQVGQVANKTTSGVYKLVPDGDYFRSLSEYGLGAIIFFLSILFFYLLLLLKGKFNRKSLCIATLMGGIFIQMIGSNVTEFFFVNFIVWAIWGYFFRDYMRMVNLKK